MKKFLLYAAILCSASNSIASDKFIECVDKTNPANGVVFNGKNPNGPKANPGATYNDVIIIHDGSTYTSFLNCNGTHDLGTNLSGTKYTKYVADLSCATLKVKGPGEDYFSSYSSNADWKLKANLTTKEASLTLTLKSSYENISVKMDLTCTE